MNVTMASSAARRAEPSLVSPSSRAGLDAGLLLLRLMLAAILGAHGLIKVFGFFGGPGMARFEESLRGFGFQHLLVVLAWWTGLSEVGCSVLLVVGFATPLAAAGLFGQALSLTIEKFGGGFFEGTGKGFEFELALTVMALVLLLAGSGRWSLDVNMPWRKNPLPYGLTMAGLAVVASVLVLTLL
jgi:putative oxidoreductase